MAISSGDTDLDDEEGDGLMVRREKREVLDVGTLPFLDLDEVGGGSGAGAEEGGRAIFDVADESAGVQKAVLYVQIDFAHGSADTAGTGDGAEGANRGRVDTLGTITAYVVDRHKLHESGYQFAYVPTHVLKEMMKKKSCGT